MNAKAVSRFLDRVVIDPDGCWRYEQPIGRDGYGRYGQRLAHRLVYELLVGEIPPGMQLDHLCHTRDESCQGGPCLHRSCVNPAHLEPVTQAENKARGRSGRHRSNGVECLRGHSDWLISAGRRTCRPCRDERVARWQQEKADHLAAYAEAHREEKRAYNREYHAKNRAQRLAYMAERRAARKEA